jgi:hypothetical protein
MLGVGGSAEVGITAVRLVPRRVVIGSTLRLSFDVTSTGRLDQELLVDYAVHFVKANGTTRPKVFKLRKIALPPSGRVTLRGTISFEDMTTRRHYPGRHRIDVLINGEPRLLAEFDVRARPRRA